MPVVFFYRHESRFALPVGFKVNTGPVLLLKSLRLSVGVVVGPPLGTRYSPGERWAPPAGSRPDCGGQRTGLDRTRPGPGVTW